MNSKLLKKHIKTVTEIDPFKSDHKWYKPKEVQSFIQDWLKYRDEYRAYLKQIDDFVSSSDRKEVTEKTAYIPRDVQVTSNYLQIRGKFVQTYFLDELPNEVYISQLLAILNLPIPFTLSYHIQGTKKSKIIRGGSSKISALEGKLMAEKERGKTRNLEVERHIQELHKFTDSINSGSEQAFYVSMYVTIEADSVEQLNRYDRLFRDETADIQYTFYNSFLNQEKALHQNLPIIKQDPTELRHLVHTSGVVNILPFLSKNTTDHEGIFLGSNTHNGSLVLIDLFKTDNANFNIFGKSGSGKSVTSKLIISRLVLRGIQNVIIDPEGEYSKLTENYGGEVIEFSKTNGINPFYIYIPEGAQITKEDEENHVQVVKRLFKFFIPDHKFESGVIGGLLTEYFNSTISKNRNMNHFLDFVTAKHSKEGFIWYDDIMELAEGRSNGGYFNSDRIFDLSKEIISFNLSGLHTDEIKIPCMYILTSLVKKLADDTSRKTMIYVDEAHLLLKHEITGKFLQMLSKTVRKRNTGLVCISQELEDFKEENGGKTIIAQAESNFILKQSNISVNHIRDKRILPLTEEEFRSLTGMERGSCIYIRQNEHLKLHIIPFEEERDLVFTSENIT